jgi:cysteine desulfurase
MTAAGRVYLDWNATAPLRPEARAAMLSALDTGGNPSSIHGEGRAARAIVERARAQVAALAGCAPEQVIFTAGATEAAAIAAATLGTLVGAPIEHACVAAHAETHLSVDRDGRVRLDALRPGETLALQAANSETGVLQPECAAHIGLCDAVQAVGRVAWRFDPARMTTALLSAHKLGGPAGVGALIVAPGTAVAALTPGGGQETGRRAGTENLAGIAGFGAAAEAARHDLEGDLWAGVEYLRILLENTLEAAAPDLIIMGEAGTRLPNTVCFAVPGWRGDTQVMQMDLAGFAVSAGSACSSGKIRRSGVIAAMGYDDETAGSAIRVSLGPTTTEAEVMAFARTWTRQYQRRAMRAA